VRAEDAFLRILSVTLALGAIFGVCIAWVTYALLCAGNDTGCGDAKWIMTTQLIVGLAGLGASAAMVYFSFKGSNRRAVVALVIGVIIWATWAVLNDAAVHGWGRDMVLLRPFS
jgi:hypothetical protein